MRRWPTACARHALDEFAGQPQLVGAGAALRRAIEEDRVSSSIFFGPPGTGKTTLARIDRGEHAVRLRGALRGLVGQGGRAGRDRRGRASGSARSGQRTVLFIDEIHRFNKAQQDALLPVVESGPRDADRRDDREPVPLVIGALVSRCRLYEFAGHSTRTRSGACSSAARPRSATRRSSARCCAAIAATAAGDARHALSTLELAHEHAASRGDRRRSRTRTSPRRCMRRPVRYDRDGDNHYDTISAFIKSVRGERPRRGALLPRVMLEGGEDPVYIARRHRDPRERGHRQRRPARARAGRRPARASSSSSGCPSAATRSRRRPPTSRWRPSRTPPATSLGAAPGGRARARHRPPAAGPARRQLPRRAASSAAAWATATRTTRRGRSWPTITCRPSSPARASTSRPSTASRPSLAERMRELRRLRGAAPTEQRPQRMRWPSAEQISSTASSPVMFSRSRIGFTSTTSSEPTSPRLGEQLHREVRLAVGDAAAHGGADARRARTGPSRPCRARRACARRRSRARALRA